MRYADCQGSFKCTNAKCPFRIEYGVVNSTQVYNIERASPYAESAEKKLSMYFALHDDTYGKARKT